MCSNGDEAPRAYVVPQGPDKATPELAEAIKSWLAERVSRHKRLEGGVHFIDAVPKNPVSRCYTMGQADDDANEMIVWEDSEEASERTGCTRKYKGQTVG